MAEIAFISAVLFGCGLLAVLVTGLDALTKGLIAILAELRKIRECLERREP